MENSMKFTSANYFESMEFSDSDSEDGIQGFSSNATVSCNNPCNRQNSLVNLAITTMRMLRQRRTLYVVDATRKVTRKWNVVN
jgi:hypothetical protein